LIYTLSFSIPEKLQYIIFLLAFVFFTFNACRVSCALTLEQFLKSVTRFSDKNCGKNKKIEQFWFRLAQPTACLMILADLVLESNQDGGESFHLHLDGSKS